MVRAAPKETVHPNAVCIIAIRTGHQSNAQRQTTMTFPLNFAPEGIAKVAWQDPEAGTLQEFVLVEGATATIGRSSTNDIQIAERHVSRQHAVIAFRDGVFMASDLSSANGTFVNDRQINEPVPLVHGDQIRLYVPLLSFSAIVSEEDQEVAARTGTLIVPLRGLIMPRLLVTGGPQDGQEIVLEQDEMSIGRATSAPTWPIVLQDPAVSRPHCKLNRVNGVTLLTDLGSSNGTVVNGTFLPPNTAHPLVDGDVLTVGNTTLLFRAPRAAK